jgi:hypothetical protein
MGHAKQAQITAQTRPQTTQTDTPARGEEEKENAEVMNMRPGQAKRKQFVMKDTQERVFNSHKHKGKTRPPTLAQFAGRMSPNRSECRMIIMLSP